MSNSEEFNVMDWITAVKESDSAVYSTTDEVKEQIKALGIKLKELCAQHDIPVLITFVHGSTEDSCLISETHHFLPLHRVPLEMLLSLIAVKSGSDVAVSIGADLLKFAKEE